MSVRFYTSSGQALECGIKAAREFNYKVSVTTIISDTKRAYGLERWKEEQLMLASERCPRDHLTMFPGSDLPEADESWFARVRAAADEKRNTAADFGKLLHGEIESILARFKPPAPGNYQAWSTDLDGWLDPFLQWLDTEVEEVLWTEKVLTSHLGYAGRADAKLKMKDGTIIIPDFKTQGVKQSVNWYWEWAMQLSAYKWAEEETGQPVDGCMSIVFDSQKPGAPKYRLWTPEDMDEAWDDFEAAFEWWKRLNRYYPVVVPEPCGDCPPCAGGRPDQCVYK